MIGYLGVQFYSPLFILLQKVALDNEGQFLFIGYQNIRSRSRKLWI